MQKSKTYMLEMNGLNYLHILWLYIKHATKSSKTLFIKN